MNGFKHHGLKVGRQGLEALLYSDWIAHYLHREGDVTSGSRIDKQILHLCLSDHLFISCLGGFLVGNANCDMRGLQLIM